MSEQNQTTKDMPLIAHLLELRDRILRSLLAILLVFLSLIYFANDLYLWLSAPLQAVLPENANMIATDILATFFTPFKLTAVVALFVSMPYVLHQIWGFISPGLYQHEKRFALPLLVSSILLFYAGLAFAYFVVFPLAWAFLTSIAPSGVQVTPDISAYLDVVLKIFFAFGLAFEIPVATVLLVWSGATSVESLRQKRSYVVVAVFVVGMLLTPPDVISQILLAVPMWLLFELGIFFAALGQKKHAEQSLDNDETQ